MGNQKNLIHNINAIEMNFNYIADTIEDLAHFVAELKCENKDNIKISTHMFLIADYAGLIADKVITMKNEIEKEYV